MHLIFSVLASIALISLAAHSETVIDFWNQVNQEKPELPSSTVSASTVSRIALIFPGFLFTLSLLSLRKGGGAENSYQQKQLDCRTWEKARD